MDSAGSSSNGSVNRTRFCHRCKTHVNATAQDLMCPKCKDTPKSVESVESDSIESNHGDGEELQFAELAAEEAGRGEREELQSAEFVAEGANSVDVDDNLVDVPRRSKRIARMSISSLRSVNARENASVPIRNRPTSTISLGGRSVNAREDAPGPIRTTARMNTGGTQNFTIPVPTTAATYRIILSGRSANARENAPGPIRPAETARMRTGCRTLIARVDSPGSIRSYARMSMGGRRPSTFRSGNVAVHVMDPGQMNDNEREDAFGMNQEENFESPLPEEDIQAIPTSLISQAHLDNKLQCTICLEYFINDEVVLKLICDHMFHKDCIISWLKLQCTCPLCRMYLPGSSSLDIVEHGENEPNL